MKYTYKCGRNIYKDEKPFISINREGEAEPAEVNEITQRIVNMLNIADILELNPMLSKCDALNLNK